MTETADFEDTSIMHGVLEFCADGRAFRAQSSGSGVVHVYVRSGGAYVHSARVRCGRFTPRAVFAAWEIAEVARG